jgi:asparagine synthase (glutamine-hydrolysing)
LHCVSRRYCTVFNGEVYNFIELREHLRRSGYSFQTDTDTEVIPAAYDCWGTQCLHRFNGMWAFAIWDSERKRMWLARDRFGKKPLYFYWDGRTFAFASEVRALHAWIGRQADLDAGVVRSICRGEFEWHGTDRTYLAAVKALPAGHLLKVSPGSITITRWYELHPFGIMVPRKFADQAAELRDLILDACRLRLRSDVPLATCLSGGLDSASITASIHRGLTQRDSRTASHFHQAFSASFPGTMLDETAAAVRLARDVGADLRTHVVDPPSSEQLLRAVADCDGPMHSLAFYPIWSLYRFIRETGVKVTLDGQGPDELLGGYYHTVLEAMQSALVKLDLSWLMDIYKTYGAQGEASYRSSNSYVRTQLRALLRMPFGKIKRFIRRLAGLSPAPGPNLRYVCGIPENLSPLTSELFSQFCQRHLPTLLQQYDRCSMAHGIECRMPFLDYRIVEYVFSLPDKHKVGAGYTKRILREAMKGLVPDEIRLNKTKIGFNAPIVEWFLGPLRELLLDTMRSRQFTQCEYFDGRSLARNFERWLGNPCWDAAWAFWPPVHFLLWKQGLRGTAGEASGGPRSKSAKSKYDTRSRSTP